MTCARLPTPARTSSPSGGTTYSDPGTSTSRKFETTLTAVAPSTTLTRQRDAPSAPSTTPCSRSISPMPPSKKRSMQSSTQTSHDWRPTNWRPNLRAHIPESARGRALPNRLPVCARVAPQVRVASPDPRRDRLKESPALQGFPSAGSISWHHRHGIARGTDPLWDIRRGYLIVHRPRPRLATTAKA
jgi:hypothetical protein